MTPLSSFIPILQVRTTAMLALLMCGN